MKKAMAAKHASRCSIIGFTELFQSPSPETSMHSSIRKRITLSASPIIMMLGLYCHQNLKGKTLFLPDEDSGNLKFQHFQLIFEAQFLHTSKESWKTCSNLCILLRLLGFLAFIIIINIWSYQLFRYNLIHCCP